MLKNLSIMISLLLIVNINATSHTDTKVNLLTFNFSSDTIEFRIDHNNIPLWHSGSVENQQYSITNIEADNFEKVMFRTTGSAWLELGEYNDELSGGKNYCFYVGKNGMPIVTRLDDFVGSATSNDLLFIINETGRELSKVKLSSEYEASELGLDLSYDNIEDHFLHAYPIKAGDWKIFWEFSDTPDYYMSLPNENNDPPLTEKFTGGKIYILLLFTDELEMSTYTKLLRI